MDHLFDLLARDFDKPSAETGYDRPGVNPYLNTPPTELAEKVKHVRDPKKKRQIEKALEAWRGTYGNPMAPGTTGGGGLGGVAADVGTDVAEIWAISPEQLHHFIEDLNISPDMDWDEWVERLEEFETALRQHGGAVFHTNSDGAFEVSLRGGPGGVDEEIEGEGFLHPYGTSDYRSARDDEEEKEPSEYVTPMEVVDEGEFHPCLHGEFAASTRQQPTKKLQDIPQDVKERAVEYELKNVGTPYPDSPPLSLPEHAADIALDRIKQDPEYYDRLLDRAEKGTHPAIASSRHIHDLKDVPKSVQEMALEEEMKVYRNKDTAKEVADMTLLEDPEYYKRMEEVDESGYHPFLHVGVERMAGILDAVRDKRMDWLWDYDPNRDVLYVKQPALDNIENVFYKHMEDVGFPRPAYKWVLTMAIVGGAASLQWKAGSDVDVSVVIDWAKLFKEMQDWPLRKWKNIGLGSQYGRIQKGERIQGKLVAKAVRDALWGFGNFKGEGIIDDPALNKIAPGHPINYRIMRRLHKDDLRFDAQPPVIDGDSISAYIAELPIRRRREEEGLGEQDINWVQRARDLPQGFDLKRDVPDVYNEALGLLRHGTMPFDFLWSPRKPDDIPRALGVLKTRYDRVKHDLRTEGYKAYQADPNAHSFTLNGETYALPDAFPANIAVKLMEDTGAEEAITELLYKRRQYRNKDWVRQNFSQAKDEIQKLLYKPYTEVRELLKDWSDTPRYQSPAPTKP